MSQKYIDGMERNIKANLIVGGIFAIIAMFFAYGRISYDKGYAQSERDDISGDTHVIDEDFTVHFNGDEVDVYVEYFEIHKKYEEKIDSMFTVTKWIRLQSEEVSCEVITRNTSLSVALLEMELALKSFEKCINENENN